MTKHKKQRKIITRKPIQQKIWEFLRKLDIFSISFDFQTNSENKFQSSTGGLWLISFILLSLGLYINTIVCYINDPRIISNFYENQMNFKIPEDRISLDNENFIFGLYLKRFDSLPDIDEPFIFKAFHVEKNEITNFDIKKTELPSIGCSLYNFSSDYINLSYNKKEILKDTKCFNTTGINLRGFSSDDDYSLISIETYFNPDENITSLINSSIYDPPLLKFVYSDILVDHNDYSNYSIHPNEIIDNLNFETTKIIDLYLARYTYEQDLNYIINNVKKFLYTKYERAIFRSMPNRNSQISPISILNILPYKNNKKKTEIYTEIFICITGADFNFN